MELVESNRAGRRIGRALACAAAALVFATAVAISGPADAAHGGGGFHGGVFHTGGRGIAGGMHGAALHGSFAGLHNGFAGHGGHWTHGWQNGRYGWWWGEGLGSTYNPYPDEWNYGGDSFPASTYSDPPGYYPYMTHCNTAWQTAPGS